MRPVTPAKIGRIEGLPGESCGSCVRVYKPSAMTRTAAKVYQMLNNAIVMMLKALQAHGREPRQSPCLAIYMTGMDASTVPKADPCCITASVFPSGIPACTAIEV